MLKRCGWAGALVTALVGTGEAATQLSLTPVDGSLCLVPGQTLVVDVELSDTETPIVGGQFHIGFDCDLLIYEGGTAGDEPFTRPIVDLTPAPGRILYAVGVPDGGTGSSADTVLARLTFTVRDGVEACQTPDVVTFAPDDGAYRTLLSDGAGQPVWPVLSGLPAITIDNVPPILISCPLDISQTNDPGVCSAVVGWTVPNATDNCGGVTVEQTAGLPPGSTFAVGGPYTIQYTATDLCGNVTACAFTVTVTDDEAPTITCPPDVQVAANAGECHATEADLGTPVAADNCGLASVTNDAPTTFPVGDTMVTWTAVDIHGNNVTCAQTVTVLGLSELVVDVQLSPLVVAGPITRCITFELRDCPAGAPSVILDETLTFTSGLAEAVTLLVPCGQYSCLSARDKLHSLRQTVTPTVVDNHYEASFTGDPADDGNWLILGNLNDDDAIDQLDFVVYAAEYATAYGSLDATCTTPYPHADFNGDGVVDTADFTFMQVHSPYHSDGMCCSRSVRPDGDGLGTGRTTSGVSIGDLDKLGLGCLAVGDRDHDGRLQLQEIVTLMRDAWRATRVDTRSTAREEDR